MGAGVKVIRPFRGSFLSTWNGPSIILGYRYDLYVQIYWDTATVRKINKETMTLRQDFATSALVAFGAG